MSQLSAHESHSQALVWRFPRWGTTLGVLFWLLMLGGLGGFAGFIFLFGVMLGALPFLAIAGEDLGPKIGLGVEALLVIVLLGRQVWRSVRADTQHARDRALNCLALGVLVLGALMLSVVILEREWPH
jgi:hypothetical protein